MLGSAWTTGAGIREAKIPTTEIIKELILAAHQNLREGKMAMIDYLFYVGNLSYSVRKGSKNDNAGEEEGDEGEE